MPSKSGYYTSTPESMNSSNGATFSPSRRSPRVPVTGKTINSTPQSSKSLDLSSTPRSDSSFNFRFYNPKTPSTPGRPRNSSPDLPSTRHRTFQARPSRLSTVYPPTFDTPTSGQSTRPSRRNSTCQTPHSHLADDEFSEGVGSTGWTYDQYTGGLDYDQAMARATSPTSTSSATTRRSTRERKPTAKALESLQQQQRQPSRRSKNAKTEAQDDAFPTDLAGLNGPEEAAPVEAAPKPARAKKAPVKEAPVKKQPVKKQPAKKGTAKKGTAKKDPMKKEPVQKESAKKQAEKKKPTKKESVEKEPVKKQPVKEQTEKKEPAKKEPAKKESVKKQPVKKPAAKPTPVETPAPVPAPAAPTTQAVAKPGSKKAKKTVTLGNTKVSKKTKPTVLKIKICMKRAGLKLYECAVQALGPDFKLPSDPEQLIAEARRSFERSVGIAPEESPVPNQTPADDGDDELDVPTIKKYKKSAPPRLQSGWVLSGRANDNGEEVTLSPSTISPYRSPNTYGDEALPQPPIRSRTVSDVEKDNALGFPPLLGDRNIPFGPEAQFQPEDVTEVQARVKTRGKARQKKDSGSAGPTETGKKSRARKQRETEATSKVEASVASSTPGDGNTKPAQRRHGARAPKAAAIKTESEAPVVESDKPKITRIRLTLKPQASADVAPPTATPSSPALAAPPKGTSPKKPSASGGKKRALDLTSEVEPVNKAPSKRARRGPRK